MPMYKDSTRNTYFKEKLSKQMEQICDYPCTLIEASMGYGKTTAIREYLRDKEVPVLWLNIYDNLVATFWTSFSRLFRLLDKEQSENLVQLGFPNDIVSIREAIRIIADIGMPDTTVLVLDDYHLTSGTEIDTFIEYLVREQIENLHIILSSRYISLSFLEEHKLKGYICHITQDSFELDAEEIKKYYGLCKVNIKKAEADMLYSYTEGWISALYLILLNYCEVGIFDTKGSMDKLMEHAVYDPFSKEIKEFLQKVCIFEGFTLEQAAHMWGNDNAQMILNEIINENALVKFDHRSQTYQIHNILTMFLRDILIKMGTEYNSELYKKAGSWYKKSGDYLAAMHYFYLAKEYDNLLQAVEEDRGHSIHNEQKEVFIQYFKDCPDDIIKNHPIALLIFGLCMFSFNEVDLFQKVCNAFGAAIQREDHTLEEAKLRELMGEFELLLNFTSYNNITEMMEHLKKADEYLQQPARFMDTKGGLTFGAPSLLYMFYRESGKLERDLWTFKEAIPYYKNVTNGHGTGGEFVMEAEWHYCRGDFDTAAITIHKALDMATRYSQGEIIISAMFLQIRLALYHGDYAKILSILKKMREDMKLNNWYNLMHTIDLCEDSVYAGLKQKDRISSWILEGDFNSSRIYFPAMAYMNIVYGRVLLIHGEHHKLLGLADYFIEIASVFPNLMGQIYTYIYMAAANWLIFRQNMAMDYLKKALDIAMPDEVFMPFVENCDYIKPLLEELGKQEISKQQIKQILELYEEYQKSINKINQETAIDSRPKLTAREMEIAGLAADGLMNREIGERLFVTENTVKMALKSIYSKLSINNRVLLKQHIEKIKII